MVMAGMMELRLKAEGRVRGTKPGRMVFLGLFRAILTSLSKSLITLRSCSLMFMRLSIL